MASAVPPPRRRLLKQHLAFQALAITVLAAFPSFSDYISYDYLPKITANETNMLQLMQNLVANAIKFKGEAVPEVHVSAELRENEWLFSVKDN